MGRDRGGDEDEFSTPGFVGRRWLGGKTGRSIWQGETVSATAAHTDFAIREQNACMSLLGGKVALTRTPYRPNKAVKLTMQGHPIRPKPVIMKSAGEEGPGVQQVPGYRRGRRRG